MLSTYRTPPPAPKGETEEQFIARHENAHDAALKRALAKVQRAGRVSRNDEEYLSPAGYIHTHHPTDRHPYTHVSLTSFGEAELARLTGEGKAKA